MKTESFILKLILYFNVAILFFYILSPLSIHSNYHILNIIYVGLNIYMIKRGFDAGAKRFESVGTVPSLASISTKYFNFILVFYLLTFLLRYAYMLYLPPFDIGALVNRISIGIADPYLGRRIEHGARTLPWTIFFLTSIIDSIFFIIALVTFKSLKFFEKALSVILMIIDGLFWMGRGTNFGVIMLISCVVFAFLIQIGDEDLDLKKNVKYLILCSLALFLVVFIFSYNMEGRSGGDVEHLSGDFLALGSSVSIDDNSPMLVILPDRIRVFFLFITSYLTQGYMFLENIYSLDFHWGGFFGNNPALQSIAQDFLWFNPEENSYQMQMEAYGVDPSVNWHSCFLWLANDFTLFGVPFVIFFISKMTSVALSMFRQTKDILTGVVFVVFANMLVFLFANNNYLSSVFYSFIFIFPYWYFTRYKRHIKS